MLAITNATRCAGVMATATRCVGVPGTVRPIDQTAGPATRTMVAQEAEARGGPMLATATPCVTVRVRGTLGEKVRGMATLIAKVWGQETLGVTVMGMGMRCAKVKVTDWRRATAGALATPSAWGGVTATRFAREQGRGLLFVVDAGKETLGATAQGPETLFALAAALVMPDEKDQVTGVHGEWEKARVTLFGMAVAPATLAGRDQGEALRSVQAMATVTHFAMPKAPRQGRVPESVRPYRKEIGMTNATDLTGPISPVRAGKESVWA